MTPYSRRDLLRNSAAGFGWLALAALAAERAHADGGYRGPLAPKDPHFKPRAKRVIFLFMNGGPTHLDTFDWKPELAKVGGPGNGGKGYLAPAFPFKPAGKSGLMIADCYPHLAKQADELCLLNGVTTNNPGHHQAVVALHTGSERFVRPSVGAWVAYGLGTEAKDLPGFITIDPIADQGGAQNYGSAFLPASYQGTRLGGGQRAVPNIAPALPDADQRKQLDFVQKANRRLLDADPGHPELEGLIESYEMAYKMQTSVPDTLDLGREPKEVRELYGLDDPTTQHFATQCLMARRLAEKGVRFIQLTSSGWDHHQKIREGLGGRAAATDKPMAGLIADLKRRGMLKDTLIVWGGEFGRGPREDRQAGRGHHNRGFTVWMAGGGVKGGIRYGATDELGDKAVEGVMGTHDLHATILALLGLDHERLTFRYAGRDFRLTDVHGHVHEKIFA
jgi:hypothetical protein